MVRIVIVQFDPNELVSKLQIKKIKQHFKFDFKITIVKNGDFKINCDKLVDHIFEIDNPLAGGNSYHHAFALNRVCETINGPFMLLDQDVIPIANLYLDFDVLAWNYYDKLVKEGNNPINDFHIWPGLFYSKSSNLSICFNPKNGFDTGWELKNYLHDNTALFLKHKWIENYDYPNDLFLIDDRPCFFHISKSSNWQNSDFELHSKRMKKSLLMLGGMI